MTNLALIKIVYVVIGENRWYIRPIGINPRWVENVEPTEESKEGLPAGTIIFMRPPAGTVTPRMHRTPHSLEELKFLLDA